MINPFHGYVVGAYVCYRCAEIQLKNTIQSNEF